MKDSSAVFLSAQTYLRQAVTLPTDNAFHKTEGFHHMHCPEVPTVFLYNHMCGLCDKSLNCLTHSKIWHGVVFC